MTRAKSQNLSVQQAAAPAQVSVETIGTAPCRRLPSARRRVPVREYRVGLSGRHSSHSVERLLQCQPQAFADQSIAMRRSNSAARSMSAARQSPA